MENRTDEAAEAIEDVDLPNIEMENFTEEDAREFAKIEQRFVRAYAQKEESDTEGNWLFQQLKAELPEKSEEELKVMTKEIRTSVEETNNDLMDLNQACDAGVSKEQWFAEKVSEASVGVSMVEFGNYLSGIDTALSNGNAQMFRTITTNAGEISQCVNLDGFIAEQYAVNTFNRQAALEGAKYVAEVKVPAPGETYGLNSFDTVIKDSTGKIVHQYQFKFGKDAKATIGLLKDGNYNNQRFVVPAEQVEEVRKAFPGKSVESYMGGTEQVSTKSSSLTKDQAKQLQHDVQTNGELPQQNWNVYNTKELAMNIGKNAGCAGVQAMAVTTGFAMAEKAIKGEKIDAEETVELALRTGADAGIKEATAGALKVGAEKGVLKMIPPGTPAGTIAKIAFVAIEDAKILAKVAKGDMTLSEGIDNIARTSIAAWHGLGWAVKGATIGAAALSWIPIVGPFVGGLVGGMVGYMAGSKVGSAIYSGAKKVGKAVVSSVKKVVGGVKAAGRKVAGGIKATASAIGGYFRR